MENTSSSDRFKQLKETDCLPKFLSGTLDTYRSAIARNDDYGQLGVYKGDLLVNSNKFLDKISNEFPNPRRENVLRELMYDLLPAKKLFDDNGNLIDNLVKNDASNSDSGLGDVLRALPNALLVGQPIIDANSVIGKGTIDSKDIKRVDKDLLLEVAKKDSGGKSPNEEHYEPRHKLARLSLVFDPNTLAFLFKVIKNEGDFDLFIDRIKSGDIPVCLISTDETRRTIAFWDYKNKSKANKWLATDPVPPLPAFGRMVQRYKTDESIGDILDTLRNEEPYSEDRDHNSSRKYYTMVPVISSDPTDLP